MLRIHERTCDSLVQAFHFALRDRSAILYFREWPKSGSRRRLTARILVLALHSLELVRKQWTKAVLMERGRVNWTGVVEQAPADLPRSGQSHTFLGHVKPVVWPRGRTAARAPGQWIVCCVDYFIVLSSRDFFAHTRSARSSAVTRWKLLPRTCSTAIGI